MKYFLIILALLILPLASATLVISPNPINITTNVNEEKTFNLQLKNNFNFSILDFKFGNLTDYGFTFPSLSIDKNSSRTIEFKVKTTKSMHELQSQKVEFKYHVNIPEDTTTHYINITATGFNPDYLITRQGDTVIWRNIDDISHSVTCAKFDEDLMPNETLSKVFNTIETIDYQDLVMFFPGTVNVINKSSQEKVHNPNYDVIWNLRIDSLLDETILEIQLLDIEFNVSATEQTEGSMRIKNTGNEKAEVINLKASKDWLDFEENNFNLEIGEQKYVDYTIMPSIFATNQTNQTYNIDITVKASNSQIYNKTIKVFIPYSNIFQDLDSEEGFMVWFAEVYCKEHPNLFLCNTSVATKNGSIIYKDPEIPMNISLIDFYELKKDFQKSKDSQTRTENKLKALADKYELSMPQIMELLNQSVNKQEDNEKRTKSQWNSMWIIGFIIFVVGLVLFMMRIVKKKQEKEIMLEGQYKWKQ